MTTPSAVKAYSKFIDLLLRTHSRKLTYLYTGFIKDDFIIGSADEDDLKHNIPGQSIGLFKIHKDRDIIYEVLDKFKIDLTKHAMTNLKHIATYLSKVKYDLSSLVSEKDDYGFYFLNQDKKIYYSFIMDNYFSVIKLKQLIDRLIEDDCRNDKIMFPLDHKEIKKDRKFKYKLDLPDLKNRSLVIQEGNDIPLYGNNNPSLCLIKHEDGNHFHYTFGGQLDHEDITIFIQRINSILV